MKALNKKSLLKKIFIINILFFSGIGLTWADTTKANYKITFVNLWNKIDHIKFPGNAHYSPIIAVNHNAKYQLIELDTIASLELEDLAETGNSSGISQVIAKAQTTKAVEQFIKTQALFPRSDGDKLSFNITLSKTHPFLSLVTMIAPSPDWVVGINSLNLYRDQHFIEYQELDLYAIDAGTEDGDVAGNFSTNNRATIPQKTIRTLKNIVGFDKPFVRLIIEKIDQ